MEVVKDCYWCHNPTEWFCLYKLSCCHDVCGECIIKLASKAIFSSKRFKMPVMSDATACLIRKTQPGPPSTISVHRTIKGKLRKVSYKKFKQILPGDVSKCLELNNFNCSSKIFKSLKMSCKCGKIIKHTFKHDDNENIIHTEAECAICLQQIGWGLKLECNHKFHSKCIKEITQKAEANHALCPLCRQGSRIMASIGIDATTQFIIDDDSDISVILQIYELERANNI